MSATRVIRWFLVGFFLLLCGLASALYSAPATWLDSAAKAATGGRLRLAEAHGSVWRGHCRLVWVDVGDSAQARMSLPGIALPGRVYWEISPLPLLLGLVEVKIRVDGMAQPVALQGSLA